MKKRVKKPKETKQRVWKNSQRDDFQAYAIRIIEEHYPECRMVHTITGQIFDKLIMDYE